MTQPSAEQLQIIGAPVAPMAVIACAGSGKTFTAVRRLAHMRHQFGDRRGRVALLSFSNVAIDTFRREYRNLSDNASGRASHDRVEIGTLDSFITGNVLRPHAYRTMGCDRMPFLIAGTEPFLQNRDFQFWAQPSSGQAFPVRPALLHKVIVNIEAGRPTFRFRQRGAAFPINNGPAATARLGAVGAYSHDLGRYWCYRTLVEQPAILNALVRRYPHVLIDEAQDIGTVHQAIIELMIGAGCQVSLIGDPNQGIYEFDGADGSFLSLYGQRAGVTTLALTRNYRSVPSVLDLANRLSTRTDTAERNAPEATNGAYFVPYRNADRENLVAAFRTAVLAADLKIERSAVLCRSRDMADTLSGNEGAPGQGLVKNFAQAAILRDQHKDYMGALKLVAVSIVGLLADPPPGLVARIARSDRSADDRALRRLIWAFTRNSDAGLPAATLIADTQWHQLLFKRTRILLAQIAQSHGHASANNLGNKLARRALPNAPLIAAVDLTAIDAVPHIRVDTVHQAKGESLDAVLYLANREHAAELLTGVATEVGRIGYVAVTRARNLLWLGIPANALADMRPALAARGFQELGAAIAR